MTAPVYQETFFGQTTTNGTNHSVTLPATINRGDLLILVCASDGNPTMSAPSGWTVIQPAAYNGTAVGLAVFGKVAVGTEDGTSVTWTTGASEQTSTVGARVTGWGGTLADIKVGTAATGLSTGPNPPSLNPPDYGTEDFLWLAYLAADSNKSVSGGPGGGFSFGSQQGSSTNNATAALARLAQNNNVMDPGAFTLSGSDDWVANTIAIIGTKTLFTEDFEGRGTNPTGGDALSSTNTFWDLFNGVGTREFAGSPKNNGNFSGEFITSGTGQALVKDTTTLPGVVNGGTAYKSLWFRFYVRTPDDMNIDNRIFVIEESSADGGSDIAVIRLSGADGFATILDGTTVRATGTHQVDSHAHQHRMELWVDQETDYFELRMWWGADSNDPSTSATNYESISGTLSSNDVMQVFGVGNFSGVNASLYIDDFAVGIGGWLGPAPADKDIDGSLSVAFSNSASLTVVNDVSASLAVALSNSASFSVVNDISATLAVAFSNSATLDVPVTAKTIDGSLAVALSDTASLAVTRNTSASLAVAFSNSGTLAATRNATASLPISLSNTATLAVQRNATASLAVAFSDTATLAVTRAASASLAVALSNSASLTVVNDISGSLSIAFSNTATFDVVTAAPEISGSLSIVFSNSAAFSVTNDIAASLPISLSNSATLTVTRSTTASLAVAFSNSAALAVTNDVSASLPISLNNSASLSVTNDLQATLAVAFSNSAAFAVTNDLQATLAVAMANSATFAVVRSMSASLAVAFSNTTSLVRAANISAALPVLLDNTFSMARDVSFDADLEIEAILAAALQVPGTGGGRPGSGQLWPRGNL